MKCQDCVHYEVCLYRANQFKSVGVEVDWDENYADVCMMSREKSRFVELPCEVGSTVYFVGVLTQQIVPSKVLSIDYNEGGFYLFCGNYLIVIVTEQLGKTVFLSREEAENALRERSK